MANKLHFFGKKQFILNALLHFLLKLFVSCLKNSAEFKFKNFS